MVAMLVTMVMVVVFVVVAVAVVVEVVILVALVVLTSRHFTSCSCHVHWSHPSLHLPSHARRARAIRESRHTSHARVTSHKSLHTTLYYAAAHAGKHMPTIPTAVRQAMENHTTATWSLPRSAISPTTTTFMDNLFSPKLRHSRKDIVSCKHACSHRGG